MVLIKCYFMLKGEFSIFNVWLLRFFLASFLHKWMKFI